MRLSGKNALRLLNDPIVRRPLLKASQKEMEKRGLIDKFAKRFIAISRNEKLWLDIKDEVLDTFDTEEEQRIFKISDISKYHP